PVTEALAGITGAAGSSKRELSGAVPDSLTTALNQLTNPFDAIAKAVAASKRADDMDLMKAVDTAMEAAKKALNPDNSINSDNTKAPAAANKRQLKETATEIANKVAGMVTDFNPTAGKLNTPGGTKAPAAANKRQLQQTATEIADKVAEIVTDYKPTDGKLNTPGGTKAPAAATKRQIPSVEGSVLVPLVKTVVAKVGQAAN
ncbi:hypothetical protein O988_06740, partial [Pseudogymnoascus sp. VKM F-3808]